MDSITLENIIQVMGVEKFRTSLANADLVSLLNWTMITNMTGIMRSLVEEGCPLCHSVKDGFSFRSGGSGETPAR